MSKVAAAARAYYKYEPLDAAVHLELQFRMPRPKSHYRTGRNAHLLKSSAPLHHAVKPDLTKLVRSTEDALTGIIWRDDAQVISGSYSKTYADETAGVAIKLTLIN